MSPLQLPDQAARPAGTRLGSRQAAVLEHLAAYPGQTASELGRAVGISLSVYPLLRRLEQTSRVVGAASQEPGQSLNVTRWRLAPSGPVPPSGPPAGSPGPVTAAAPGLPQAACEGADPDLFFPPDGELAGDRHLREARAKAVCAGCPVRGRCLELAAARGERWGIWGGVDFAMTSTGRKAS